MGGKSGLTVGQKLWYARTWFGTEGCEVVVKKVGREYATLAYGVPDGRIDNMHLRTPSEGPTDATPCWVQNHEYGHWYDCGRCFLSQEQFQRMRSILEHGGE